MVLKPYRVHWDLNGILYFRKDVAVGNIKHDITAKCVSCVLLWIVIENIMNENSKKGAILSSLKPKLSLTLSLMYALCCI